MKSFALLRGLLLSIILCVVSCGASPAPTVVTQGNSLTPDQIFQKDAPSVVIVMDNVDGGAYSGAGFIAKLHDHVVVITARHIFDMKKSVSAGVILKDGTAIQLPLKSVAYDPSSTHSPDVAIMDLGLAANWKGPAPLTVSDQDEPIGSRLCIIGHPGTSTYTLNWNCTCGVVSNYFVPDVNTNSYFANERFMGTDAQIYYGNSGGPALNQYGEVVGICSWSPTTEMTYIGYFVPGKEIAAESAILFNSWSTNTK